MNAERLLLLAEFLDSRVPAGRWNFRSVVGPEWRGGDLVSCGATACAIGWSATIPELAAAGMRLEPDSHGYLDAEAAFRASRAVFGITDEECDYLFVPDEDGWDEDGDPVGAWHFPDGDCNPGWRTLTSNASARSVADRIRSFVAKGGIAMEYPS